MHGSLNTVLKDHLRLWSYRFRVVLFALAFLVACQSSLNAAATSQLVSGKFAIRQNGEYAESERLSAESSTPGERDDSDLPEAPSPWWLVVMPAIPLMGGGLIYAKRRLFGSGLERYEVSSSVSSGAINPESAVPQSEDTDPENTHSQINSEPQAAEPPDSTIDSAHKD